MMSKVKQSLDGLNNGWVINIYGSDRRLVCTLEPSHAWAFVTGVILGGLVMVTFSVNDRPRHQPAAIAHPDPAPLAID